MDNYIKITCIIIYIYMHYFFYVIITHVDCLPIFFGTSLHFQHPLEVKYGKSKCTATIVSHSINLFLGLQLNTFVPLLFFLTFSKARNNHFSMAYTCYYWKPMAYQPVHLCYMHSVYFLESVFRGGK